MSKRLRWRYASSHVEFVVVLDGPDFSVVINSDPLDISINKDPFLTKDNLVSDSSSPIEIVTTINEEYMILVGLHHLVASVNNIFLINWDRVRTNIDSSHPKFVVTINSPSHLTFVE